MRVDILTPPRLGGPFFWASDLAEILTWKGIEARHVYQRHSLLSLLAHESADMVHTTIPLPFKLWRKPMVVTVKGDYTIEKNFVGKFYPNTISHADVVTVPSQYLKDKLELGKAEVIPNAVFPEKFNMIDHKERPKVNLVTICNMYFRDKTGGLVHLFNVLSRIDSPKFELTVVGDGAYKRFAMAQTNGLGVNFIGFVDDVASVLCGNDIFVYYSPHDNFPNVLLEAMASGLAVVTNNVGAVNEIISDGEDGDIADNDDDYIFALRCLMGSITLRQEMGIKARQTVMDRFNWHTVADRYLEIYKEVLK